MRIVELGAGTGWLGLLLAHNVAGLTRVLLTEMDHAHCLQHLQAAVDLNRRANLAR
jgi:tRNA1(Val) A37 N6-methylase TrmN6